MREAIGSTRILFIVIVIIIATMMLLSASIGYTKAFKARNIVINAIQRKMKYGMNPATLLNEAQSEIDPLLKELGYKANIGTNTSCTYKGEQGALDTNYNYCVFQVLNEDCSMYYRVQTYIYYELPIFGRNDRFAIPISANTYTIYPTKILSNSDLLKCANGQQP